MIITTKKSDKEILDSVKDAKTVFLVNCLDCAKSCGTGDDKAVAAVTALLEANGKTVLGSKGIDSVCDERLSKRDLLKDENFAEADAILILACGSGVQSVESISQKNVVPALDSGFPGVTERIGVYKKFCGVCGGECILALTGTICPKTRCPKGLVNGPCGGFANGKCETDPNKDCAWVLIYEKLKKNGKLERFLNQYIEPKK